MTTHKVSTLIAFDFGTQRIGVAVGTSLLATGNPLPPLRARDGIPEWGEIERIIKEWQPDLLIVGLPLNMDGSESEMSKRARKFGNRLHGRLGLPVHMLDERLSTREAKSQAKTRGHQGNYRDDPIDSIAASILLEDWWQQSSPRAKPV